MLPDSKSEDLLYLSEQGAGYGDVVVYSYKMHQEVGKLTGFTYPSGQCVDVFGDVWITDDDRVVEYAHGGTKPVKQVIVKDGAGAFGCAVSSTGDLAVSTALQAGKSEVRYVIEIFKHASYKGVRVYSNSECFEMGRPGFDDHGNLYVQCFYHYTTSSYSYKNIGSVMEVPAGAKTLGIVPFTYGTGRRVTLRGTGSAMWDGQHITFSDIGTQTSIYRAKQRKDGSLEEIGDTRLEDSNCADGNDYDSFPFLVGTKNGVVNHEMATAVLGANDFDYCTSHFNVWRYPAGGDQTWYIQPGFFAYGESVTLARP